MNASINTFLAIFYVNGLVQDCSNSNALAMELLQIESDKTTSIYNVSTRVLSKNKALVERGK